MSSSKTKRVDASLHICTKFFDKCRTQNLETIQSYYHGHSVTINNHKAFVFEYLCRQNYLEIAQWYFSVLSDIHHDFLYQQFLPIELGYVNAFKIACEKGHLEIVRWLHTLSDSGIPGPIKDDSFRKACANNRLNIVEWFILLRPERYSFSVEEKEIITIIPHVDDSLPQEMDECDILPCSVCMMDKSQIITVCNHQFCQECLDSWLKVQKTCPMCRDPVLPGYFFTIVPK